MPSPAAHPYCFLCANSSAHLACTKQIREWIQLEASQGKKEEKKEPWRWISVGSNSQISSRHTNISMCPGEVQQKHYFWQEPTFMLYLSNYITTDFNKGDTKQRKVIFWEGQAHKLSMQKCSCGNLSKEDFNFHILILDDTVDVQIGEVTCFVSENPVPFSIQEF